MINQILLVVHRETSDPGLVGQLLQRQGYYLDRRCPAIGDELPTRLDRYAGVVVFGGPMSANDDDTLPFIRAELNWIPRVLDADIPYLGICLGSQLLARSLGATVSRHPKQMAEMGYFPIQVTAAGQESLGGLTHVFHWHNEGFELPRYARLLATGDRFPNQAFQYGDRVYGLQFHPEATHVIVDRWTTDGAEQLVKPGAQPRSLQLHHHVHYAAKVYRWLNGFLPQWLETAEIEQVA